MNELSKADTLEVLKNIKREFEKECELAYDSFSLFPNKEDVLRWDILSAYVAAMETAVECVEKNLEDKE